MNKISILKNIFILGIFLLLGFSVQAQYFKAELVNEDIKAIVKKHYADLGNSNEMFVSCPQGISVFGQVFRGLQSVDNGIALLFSYDTINSSYTFYAATTIQKTVSPDISFYNFDTVPKGVYTTLVALSSSEPYYNQYAPAYLGNTFYWTSASNFLLDAPGYNYAINLIDVEPVSGVSSISGKVLEGSAKSPGDPIANVPLYLLDDDGNVRAYTYSDALGEYSFSNLSYGKYHIYSNIINFQIHPSVTTTSASGNNKDSINIYVRNGIVTSIHDLSSNANQARVFPNPIIDNCNLEFTLQQDDVISLRVINSNGQEVKTPIIKKAFCKGRHIEKFAMMDMAKGVYYLIIESKLAQAHVLQIIKN